MKKIEQFFFEYKHTLTVVLALITVITFFFVADDYVNNQIEKRITDETYINKLARVLRPFAIFNEENTITYDHGAEQYIEKITVKRTKDGDLDSVSIKTKVFLQTPPILTYIGYGNYAYSHERVGTYEWKFKLSTYTYATFHGEPPKVPPIFIIEITK